MKFSIVIPTFNRQATLRQTLAALRSQDYSDYEVIVVDDGSTDYTLETIADEFSTVQFHTQDHHGPAAARNLGIARARGEIFVFTDDDCVAPRNWLTRLADGYARYPIVAGVGGYLEAPDDIIAKNALARFETFIAHRVHNVGEREYLGGFECPAGGTNNMSYCRTAIESVGGFDESFPYAAGEDADLKWRLCQNGAQLLYVPVKMTHLQTYSLDSFKRQAFIRGKGKARFDAKHTTANHTRTFARLIRRALTLPFDLFDSDAYEFLAIRYIETWHNFRGEWAMLREMRR